MCHISLGLPAVDEVLPISLKKLVKCFADNILKGEANIHTGVCIWFSPSVGGMKIEKNVPKYGHY